MTPRRRPLLSSLDVELTERCNNDCVHCAISRRAGDAAARRRELTAAELDGVFSQATDLGCLTVRLTGGEPLLRGDFPEVYMAARRRGLTVRLLTNGCLLTPSLARLLGTVPPLEPVEVTAYGHDRRSYEAVTRVPGSFARFRRGLRLLAEHRVRFRLKGVLLAGASQERRRFESWAQGLSGTRPEMTLLLDLRHRRDSKERNEAISRLRLPPEAIAAASRSDRLFREQMKLFPARHMGPQGAKLFSCSAGNSVCLDASGRLQPCLLLRKRDLTYDLSGGSLRHALQAFFPGVVGARTANRRYLQRCGRCQLKGFCRQCPAISYIEHGRLDKPVEYYCRVAHQQAYALGWLMPGQKAWGKHPLALTGAT